MATWTIQSGENNGYPINLNFLVNQITNKWVDGNYNLTNWRITNDFNISVLNTGNLAPTVTSPNLYPHIWAADQILSGGGGGGSGDGFIIDTGGHSRATNQYSYGNRSNLVTSHNNHKVTTTSYASTLVGVSLNAYTATAASIQALKSELGSFATNHSADALIISQIYGGNIWNSVISCKVYPFDLTAATTGNTQNGVFSMGVQLASSETFGLVNKSTIILDFGSLNLNVTQGWEISQDQFSIYLPYCGLFNIDVKGDEAIQPIAYIDLTSGGVTYVVYINDQINFIANGEIGSEVPINLQQAQMKANAHMKKIEFSQKIVSMAASSAGRFGLVGKTVASTIPGIAESVNEGAQTLETPISQFQLGGALNAMDMYQNACIIVRERKMVNNGYGYDQAIGMKRLKGYNNLEPADNNLSGFIKCNNYKCCVDKATADEKTEICRLMNAGIIL